MTSIGGSERDRGLAAAVPEARDPEPRPVPGAARPGAPEAAPTVDPAGAASGRPRTRTWLAAIAGVIVLPVAVAAGLTWTAATTDVFKSSAADARVVPAADMEREYGIRVNLVAVSADGGLVDVRFTVVDKEKAEQILHDEDSLPALLVTSSGAVLRAPHPHAHKLSLFDGASYFLLFPNSGGAVQRGTPVSVVIDSIRLEPLVAQS